jgi:hypothetical protein
MFFRTKHDAEAYIAQIPWLRRDDGEADLVYYEIPEELYHQTLPSALLATLPQSITRRTQPDLTYGQAAGLHFFSHYDDRNQLINDYALMKVKPGEKFAGFDG